MGDQRSSLDRVTPELLKLDVGVQRCEDSIAADISVLGIRKPVLLVIYSGNSMVHCITEIQNNTTFITV